MSWNFSGIVVGLPGFGKTTLLSQLIERHLHEPDGVVLAHDPMGQFVEAGCYFYKDADAWRAAAVSSAKDKRPMPRGASIGGVDSDDVTRLAIEMGERANTAKRTTVRILVPYDEGSLREGSGSTHVSKLDNQILATRRHLGVGPILNLQEPKQLMNRWYRMATDVFLFRQTEDRAYELDTLLSLERGTLARAGVTRLEKHHYLHVRPGDGIVSDAL